MHAEAPPDPSMLVGGDSAPRPGRTSMGGNEPRLGGGGPAGAFFAAAKRELAQAGAAVGPGGATLLHRLSQSGSGAGAQVRCALSTTPGGQGIALERAVA